MQPELRQGDISLLQRWVYRSGEEATSASVEGEEDVLQSLKKKRMVSFSDTSKSNVEARLESFANVKHATNV